MHNTTVDFSEDSDKEVITEYKIDPTHPVAHFLKAGFCQDNNLNPDDINFGGNDRNVTASRSSDGAWDILKLEHSFSKDKIGEYTKTHCFVFMVFL